MQALILSCAQEIALLSYSATPHDIPATGKALLSCKSAPGEQFISAFKMLLLNLNSGVKYFEKITETP
jgi:hypothetical protein